MVKALVIYGSTTGNTEELSESIGSGLKDGGAEVVIKNVTDADVSELTDYDIIVLGCSTWGIGELQDDFIDFYEKLENISLSGKKAAVFGPGDRGMYPDSFCTAVDLIEERIKEIGVQIVVESFKVDGDIEPEMDNAKKWGLRIAESI